MPIAFVLINTEIGSESEVLAALKKIDAVKESYMVYGVYDVVAKVKAVSTSPLFYFLFSIRQEKQLHI